MALEYGMGSEIEVVMEGPFGGTGTGGGAKLASVFLPADGWKGGESPYSQVAMVAGVTMNSMVNLQPSAEQLQAFHDMDLAFTTVNEDGVVTVYAIGEKPAEDLTIQATIVEVIL